MFPLPDDLDDIDFALLDHLGRDGRATNRQLSRGLGIAESTAHNRLRRLRERGVIAGYEAVIRQGQLGRGLQALVHVTLRPGARQSRFGEFREGIRSLPEVNQMFFLGGNDDFIVHVAVHDTSALRRFVVDNLSGNPAVASTRTSIVFEYHRNTTIASFE